MSTHTGRTSKINSEINVTPMVDVMLVLLIIFMVITPMLQPGRRVELARTANPVDMSDANKADAIVIAVQRDRTIFLGNEMVSNAVLVQQLKDRLDTRINKTVYVRADARAKFRSVAEVVDGVRSAGTDQIGLLTEKVQRRQTMAQP
ncbi:MAG TPA: biopolymer transporter ExbD [Candidatus Acidoferrales bacterium]|jgi:biopolymer transport protein TolR|nr:biopolymer transporter ExbD [Candidatus Acidoferrales bacterium]